MAGGLDRFMDGPQPRHDPVGVFVVGRQQHRVAALHLRQRRAGVDTQCIPLAKQQHHKSCQRRHEREGDPVEQKNEQHQNHRFQNGDAADLQNLVHFVAAGQRHRSGAEKNGGTAERDRLRAEIRDAALPLKVPQRLRRHCQSRFRRQELIRLTAVLPFDIGSGGHGVHR